MAYEAWLRHLNLPEGCLFPMPTHCREPAACAQQYEALLRQEFYAEAPFTNAKNPTVPLSSKTPPLFRPHLAGNGRRWTYCFPVPW